MAVTINDLREGRVVRVKPSERARLLNLSQSTFSRRRRAGNDIPYNVDPITGRISYDAVDVLQEIDGGNKFTCTAEYAHNGIAKMEIARAGKLKDSAKKGQENNHLEGHLS